MRVIVFAAVLLAAYWAALVVGVDNPLVTHGAFLALITAPTVAVFARAALRRQRPARLGHARRRPHALVLGFYLQIIGDLRGAARPSFPSPADAVWLASYPCFLASFTLLARVWLQRAPRAVALETLAVLLGRHRARHRRRRAVGPHQRRRDQRARPHRHALVSGRRLRVALDGGHRRRRRRLARRAGLDGDRRRCAHARGRRRAVGAAGVRRHVGARHGLERALPAVARARRVGRLAAEAARSARRSSAAACARTRPRSSSPSRRSRCSWPTSGSRFPLPPSPSPG